jgi:hypothetical protein
VKASGSGGRGIVACDFHRECCGRLVDDGHEVAEFINPLNHLCVAYRRPGGRRR